MFCWRYIQSGTVRLAFLEGSQGIESIEQIPEWQAQGQKICHIGFGGEPTVIQLYAETPERALQKIRKILELSLDISDKGCPFCGSLGELTGYPWGYHYIVCPNCQARTGDALSVKEAWELWRRRT